MTRRADSSTKFTTKAGRTRKCHPLYRLSEFSYSMRRDVCLSLLFPTSCLTHRRGGGDSFSRCHLQIISLSDKGNANSYSWDDWVPEDRLRKLTQENRDLANTLRNEVLAQQRAARNPPAASKKKAQGSTRGSEERQLSVSAAGPRGHKRLRDHDLEKVSFVQQGTSCICSLFPSSQIQPFRAGVAAEMLLVAATLTSCRRTRSKTAALFGSQCPIG